MVEKVEMLLEDFRSNRLTRRDFIQRAVLLTGSLAAATSLIDSVFSSPARAAQVDPNDPALVSSDIKFPAADGAAITGYLSRPKGDERRPAVIVVHEWRGSNDPAL